MLQAEIVKFEASTVRACFNIYYETGSNNRENLIHSESLLPRLAYRE